MILIVIDWKTTFNIIVAVRGRWARRKVMYFDPLGTSAGGGVLKRSQWYRSCNTG